MLKEQDMSNTISSGDFNQITLRIWWPVFHILLLDVSIFVDLNSHNAIAYPTFALVVRWGKMFICCYVAIKCYNLFWFNLFWFQVDCLGHFLFGLVLAPLTFSLVDKPLCTGMEARVQPSARLAACFLLSPGAWLGFCYVSFAIFLIANVFKYLISLPLRAGSIWYQCLPVAFTPSWMLEAQDYWAPRMPTSDLSLDTDMGLSLYEPGSNSITLLTQIIRTT